MNKVAIITGANHGIGKSTAIKLAEQGFKVVITWLDPDDYDYSRTEKMKIHHSVGGKSETDKIINLINQEGGQAISTPFDLSRNERIPDIFDLAEKEFGSVTTLINNAAHAEDNDTIEKFNIGVIDRTYAINVYAPIIMIQEFLKRFKKSKLKKGSIVNLSTDGAQYFAGQIHYGASKAALEAYTRSLSIELGKYGIRINTIAPGPVHSGIPKSYITPELEEKLIENIPLGRCGQPTDIANTISFLVSEEADWITGQVIQVDGGHSWGRCL